MNKILMAPAIIIFSLLFASCKKDHVVISDDIIGEVPALFKQKVLIEENTGEWCGWCPSGAQVLEDVINANPRNVIGVSIHDSDPLELTAYNTWQKNQTKVGGFPNASIQRSQAVGRGAWNDFVIDALKTTATCGIAIATTGTNNKLNVAVHVASNELIDDNSRITVLITEDNVAQSSPGAQINYVPDEINVDDNWLHQHVLRACLTNVAGDPIGLNNLSDKKTVITFEVNDLSQYNISNLENCKIIALVHTNETSNYDSKNVLNVQSVKFNRTKNWN